LLALLERRPELRGIVLDLPETVRNDDALAAHGIEFVEGSFFERAPPGAAYAPYQFINNRNDKDPAGSFRRIHPPPPPHARLLITESVIAPGNEPDGAKWLDLLMFAVSGRERTEPDWRALLDSAGFEPVSIEDGLIQARCR